MPPAARRNAPNTLRKRDMAKPFRHAPNASAGAARQEMNATPDAGRDARNIAEVPTAGGKAGTDYTAGSAVPHWGLAARLTLPLPEYRNISADAVSADPSFRAC